MALVHALSHSLLALQHDGIPMPAVLAGVSSAAGAAARAIRDVATVASSSRALSPSQLLPLCFRLQVTGWEKGGFGGV